MLHIYTNAQSLQFWMKNKILRRVQANLGPNTVFKNATKIRGHQLILLSKCILLLTLLLPLGERVAPNQGLHLSMVSLMVA